MCGILGRYNFKKEASIDETEIKSLTGLLAHRGPDDEGFFFDKGIGFGVRRLNVIDLDTGHQPIHNEDKSIWVIYNGEIYNYSQLKTELISNSHRFYTKTDTEVLVHLYEEKGEDFVRLLNGMFAFALWDARKKKLLLVRDRFGIKPLFYSVSNGTLFFASELNPLLSAKDINKEIDYGALSNYFSYNYIPEPDSIFMDIKKLLPGHYMVFERNNIRTVQYWDMEFDNNSPCVRKVEDYLEELDALLRDSVKMMLQSDVPLGVFLSSGMDSSTIVAYMKDIINEKIKTFTVGFNSKPYNETSQARVISNIFEAEYNEIILKEDISDLIFKSMEYFAEPFGDNASLATMALSRASKDKVTVVLTGDGGDEIFGGYPTHYVYKFADIYKKIPFTLRKNLIRKTIRRIPTSTKHLSFDYLLKRFVEGADYPYQEGHFLWKAIFFDYEKERLFTQEMANLIREKKSFTIYEEYFDKVKEEDTVNQLLYVDFKTFLLSNGLVRVDRMTMANSIEARLPFLENRLVDFMAGIPARYKIRGVITKYILRRLMKNRLPPKTISMKKRGLLLPLPELLKNQLRPFTEDILSAKRVHKTGLLNPGFISLLLNEHFKNAKDNSRQIWNLIMFMVWFNRYVKKVFNA